jgi:hypothetical protein
MRFLALTLIGLAVGSCNAAPPAETAAYVAQQQAKLAALTAGKVPGAPVSCVPRYRTNDMVIINDSTIAFRNGRSQVYVNHMMGECNNLYGGQNALVTRSTTSDLCRGDIATVLDTATRTTIGSCVFGDFVPYTLAGARY